MLHQTVGAAGILGVHLDAQELSSPESPCLQAMPANEVGDVGGNGDVEVQSHNSKRRSEDEEDEQEEEEKMSQLRTFDCVPLSVNLHMHW